MSFNVKKCYMMHLSRKKKASPLQLYSMKGTPMTVVTSHPYLGVEIRSDLRWDEHVNKISRNASRTLGMVRRNLSGCCKSTKSLAYISLVRPQIEYASSVWDPYTLKHINQLEMIQRRGARFVNADYRYSSSPSMMLEKLKWQSLEVRRKMARLSMFFKASQGNFAISLNKLQKPVRQSRSSEPHTYVQIGAHSDAYKFSFFPRTVVDWNMLPYSIVEKQSVDSFHCALVNYYM